MKYFLRSHRGHEFEVEIENLSEEGQYRVRVDGREIEADFVDVDRLGQYAVRLDSVSLAASIEPAVDGELRVTLAGSGHTFSVEDERERAATALSSARSAGGETVKAAMPGVVIGVRVRAGDALEAGAPLLVLEAMKMQNEVACEHGGVVEEVFVTDGDTVASGQPLVRLAAPDEEGPAS